MPKTHTCFGSLDKAKPMPKTPIYRDPWFDADLEEDACAKDDDASGDPLIRLGAVRTFPLCLVCVPKHTMALSGDPCGPSRPAELARRR